MESTGLALAARPEVGGVDSILPHHGPVAQRQSARSDDPGGGSVEHSRGHPLYAITHAEMPPGLRAAQVGHALIEWTLAHSRPPENLVILQTKTAAELAALAERLGTERVVVFRDSDLGDAITAIAAGPEHWRALSSLPLMR